MYIYEFGWAALMGLSHCRSDLIARDASGLRFDFCCGRLDITLSVSCLHTRSLPQSPFVVAL